MKYTADQIMRGLMNYADVEILNKLPMSGKWIMGAMFSLASTKLNNIVNAFRENTLVKMLGVVDEDGMIDIDDLLVAMKDSANKYGNITLEVPMVGNLTFSSYDLDKVKSYIG